jgi:penicillin-binding protein 1A
MMKKNGCITEAEQLLADDAPLEIKESVHNRVTYVPEAVSFAVNEIKDIVDRHTLKMGGYTITTSLNLDLQHRTRDALKKGLIAVDSRHTRLAPFKKRKWPKGDRGKNGLVPGRVYVAEVTGHDDKNGIIRFNLGGRDASVSVKNEDRYNPDNLPPSKMAEIGAKIKVRLDGPVKNGVQPLKFAVGPQGAVVVLDVASGYILAMAGGDKVEPGGFNRAVSSLRQPGSSFKPFVYLEALRTRRYTPSTLLDDSPEVDGDWKPQNSHGSQLKGLVSMRSALAESLNLPAIKLIRAVGPQKVADLAKELGINSKLDPNPSLALGTSGVTPLEMAAAYAVIANRGIRKGPWIVKKIHRQGERDIPLVGRVGRPVIAREEAYVITSMLESVIKQGTGRKAAALKLPLAGKTGTTDDAKDAWFTGYSPQIATAVWVGYDLPRTLGRREYGARAALPIWIDVMKAAHEGRKVEDFVMPAGVEKVLIDPATGLLAWDEMENPVEEIFIEGTAPLEKALPPEVVPLDDFMVNQADLMAEPDTEIIDTDSDKNKNSDSTEPDSDI